MIYDNQLRYAIDIVDKYKGGEPLHVWLKDYFRAHKQMGSRDRKQLGALVYSFYRLGHTLKHLSVKDRLLAGLYLCSDQPSDLLRYFRPDWRPEASLPQKIAFYQNLPEGAGFRIADIFPWKDELSPAIDHEAFCLSFLRQPDLFIRIRPGHEQAVRAKLTGIGELIPPFTYRLPNGYKVEDQFTPDQEVVIQDYSSQRVAEFLQPGPEFFWDACAASGGKSILVHDLYPDAHLTVSDIRESIIRNLKARFQSAGIKKYNAFLADLSKQPAPASAVHADLVLTDVPCTGSGTWSRTPEELYFFDPDKITQYSALQKRILANIAPNMIKGATLVYCTCSVFKKENEEMVSYIKGFGLKGSQAENLIGYDQHADTLFAARFVR